MIVIDTNNIPTRLGKNKAYWDKRTNTLSSITRKSIKYTEKDIQQYYKDIYASIKKDAESLMNDYNLALANGWNPGVSTLHQLNRYDELMKDIESKCDRLGVKLDNRIDKSLHAQYRAVYDMSTTQLPLTQKDKLAMNAFQKVNSNYINQKIHTPWVKGSANDFSKRIWDDIDRLKLTLKDTMVNDIARGKSIDKMTRDLSERMNVSFNDARRLVRTESAHIQTEASIDSYKRHGITKVEVLLGDDPCPDCKELGEGGPYEIEELTTWFGEPPYHPNCMCSLSPVVEYEDEE